MTHKFLTEAIQQEALPMRFHFVLTVLTTLSLLTPRSLEARDYAYPYHDPFLATPTTAILSDDGATPRADSIIPRARTSRQKSVADS
jgi:hypothetical protein